MSSKVNPRMTTFKTLSEVELRERFKSAFELDPTLTPESFWKILRGVSFNEYEALLKVVDRIRQPDEFLIPSNLFFGSPSPSPDPVSTPYNKETTPSQPGNTIKDRSTPRPSKKRSTFHNPIEDSDDDPIFQDSLEKRTKKGPSLPAFNTTPKRVQSFIKGNSLGEASRDLDNEDVRPMKRRRHLILPIRNTRNPNASKRANEQRDQDFSSKEMLQSNAADSSRFPSTIDNTREKKNLFASTFSTKDSGKTPKFRITNASDAELSDTVESDEDEGPDSNTEGSDPIDNLVTPRGNQKGAGHGTNGQRGNQNDIVLKNESKTKATPWLNRLARAYFAKSLEEAPAGNLHELEAEDKEALRELTSHLESVREKAWGHEVRNIEFEGGTIWDDKNGRIGYASVNIDGVEFRPGDYVILRSDPHTSRVKVNRGGPQIDDRKPDELPDPWYARIIHLFEDEHGEAMAHFRWFEHGSKTILKELAGPHELFLLTQCDDNPLSSVAGKIRVDFLRGEKVPENGCVVEQGYLNDSHYFYRLHWQPRNEQFTDAAIHEAENSDIQDAHRCACCTELSEKTLKDQTKIIESVLNNGKTNQHEGFHRGGVDYLLNDFVYIFNDPEAPYQIGQIKKIPFTSNDLYFSLLKSRSNEKSLKIKVELYTRYDRFHKSYFNEFLDGQRHGTRDERRLYKSQRLKSVWADQIDGKCYVRHRQDIDDLEKYKDEDDCFWVADKVSDEVDPKGVIRHRDLRPLPSWELKSLPRHDIHLTVERKRIEDFHRSGKKLRGLDIFSGAGGLSMGMHLSGSVETLWAFEYSEAACRTYKKNFPKAQVYNVDANILLDRAIRRGNGEEMEPLYDCHGEPVPDLPKKGEVDFVYGGPPCQGFSKCNRYQKADDIKNSLVVMYLSFVDFYRPKYFLLENVRGLLTHRLGATQVERHRTEGGIESGTVKFILRTLTSLGYQTQHTLVQAAEHNTPQSRTRLIFWASQLGYTLPSFPQPSHVVKSRSSPLSWHRIRRAAPHAMCTVGDALSDLPPFDWINPHGVIEQTQLEKLDREHRWKSINQYEVERGEKFVGRNHQSYAYSRPLSEFQRRVRAGVSKDTLFNHVTMRWNEETTERVCSIPLRPGADHRDMPKALGIDFLSNATAARHRFYPGRFGRLDMDGIFQTCMADMTPSGKNGKVIHPTQKRVISIREYARAQSFPDWFVFDLENSRMIDIIRQIGNAVPPNLAFALGRELLKVLVQKHEEDQWTPENMKTENCSQGHEELGHGQGSREDPISFDDDDDDDDE